MCASDCSVPVQYASVMLPCMASCCAVLTLPLCCAVLCVLQRHIAMVVVGFPATALLMSRCRVCISASHSREDLDYALEVGVDRIYCISAISTQRRVFLGGRGEREGGNGCCGHRCCCASWGRLIRRALRMWVGGWVGCLGPRATEAGFC